MFAMDKPGDDRTDDRAPSGAGVVAVIGDLVGSRRAPDRRQLQRTLTAALADVNTLVPADQPLAATVGDEFQGTYPGLGPAALAVLLVRLALLDAGADVRAGLGAGTTGLVDERATPPVQDGTAWWAARRAVETAEAQAASPRSRSARSWYVDRSTSTGGEDGDLATAAPVNAYLAVRDEVVDQMSPRARRLLAHQLRGHPQAVMAEAEGVTQPAVSQALARSGALAVVRGQELLLRALP